MTDHMARLVFGGAVLSLTAVVAVLVVMAYIISPWTFPIIAVLLALAYAIGWWLEP